MNFKPSECRHCPPIALQSQGGDLRKGGASDARYAIVVDEPEARGEVADAIAVANDIFREEMTFFNTAKNSNLSIGRIP